MTLKQLIATAYNDVGFKEVAGGPSWIDTIRFDILATSPEALHDLAPNGSPRGLFRRLQSLLEDRFSLKTHVEERELPVFALIPAVMPMVNGSGLHAVNDDCEQVIRQVAGRGPGAPVPAPPPATAPGEAPPVPRCAIRASLSSVTGRAITMAQLADTLAAPAGRPVVDRSGMPGVFDVDLHWAPELPPGALLNGRPAPPSDGPSLFTAIREQLALRLNATRASVPVLVVDAASLPSPD